MAKRNVKLRDTDKENTRTPDRPDQISAMDGDLGEVIETIDLPNRADKGDVDVNASIRTDDARTDQDKDADRQRQIDNDRTGADDETEGRRGIRRRGRADGEESERVQRRVAREQALRRRSDEQVTNLTRDNQRLNERLSRIERAGTGDESTKTLKEIDAKLATLKTQLEAAIEAGETTKHASILMEMQDLQTDKKLLERDVAAAKARKPEEEQEQQRKPSTDTRPALVDDFMRANKRWWNLPSNEKLKAAAIELDKQIKEEIADGDFEGEEYSEEHMDELTVRLAKEADRLGLDVEIRDINGDVYELDEDDDQPARETAAKGRDKGKDVRDRNGKSPQGGMGGREGRRGAQSDLELARQSRARLTPDDYQTMRVFGLNPNDEEHRKRFGKERVRTILTEANRNGRGTR